MGDKIAERLRYYIQNSKAEGAEIALQIVETALERISRYMHENKYPREDVLAVRKTADWLFDTPQTNDKLLLEIAKKVEKEGDEVLCQEFRELGFIY